MSKRFGYIEHARQRRYINTEDAISPAAVKSRRWKALGHRERSSSSNLRVWSGLEPGIDHPNMHPRSKCATPRLAAISFLSTASANSLEAYLVNRPASAPPG